MIKVLIVDDSPLIRAVLTEVLNQANDIKVIGTANDPYQARDLIKQLNPDVITLDVEMPKMDGVSFLKNLMRLRPMPVIMISTLTQQGAPITLECLDLGAVDFVAKPTQQVGDKLQEYANTLHEKIRAAAQAKVRSIKAQSANNSVVTQSAFDNTKLIAIGASTGGTEAIKEVLNALPSHFPPIVITQHIPPVFSASFAERMDRMTNLSVCEAKDGQQILSDNVYIAPGNYHLEVVNRAGKLFCKVTQSEPINRHRPAVDVLFESVAKLGLNHKVGAALLTGMGADGAEGLLTLKESGALTLAQDESTSVVWGMPRAAIDIDAAQQILGLEKIAPVLANWAKK